MSEPGSSTCCGQIDYQWILDRAKRIVTDPAAEWPAIAADNHSVKEVYTKYLCVMAAIPPIGSYIGGVLGGHGAIINGLFMAVVQYIIHLVMVAGLAVLLTQLAPRYGADVTMINAVKLVGYSGTPFYTSGILLVLPIPALQLLASLFSLYFLYLFHDGVEHLTTVPADKRLAFTGVAAGCVVGIVILFVALVLPAL